MPQFLPFAATGAAGDPNFPDNRGGGGGGLLEIREFFLVSTTVNGDEAFGATTLNVRNTVGFSTAGSGFARGSATSAGDNSSPSGPNAVSWTGKTLTTLTGVTGNIGWDDNSQIFERANGNQFQDFTWIAPDDCNLIDVFACGGGGGGGQGELNGGGGNAAGGSGGSGGVYSRKSLIVTPGTTYHVRVGAGGSNNLNGNDTLFATSSAFTTILLRFQSGFGGTQGSGSDVAGATGLGPTDPFAFPNTGTSGGASGRLTSNDSTLTLVGFPQSGLQSGNAGGGGFGGDGREKGANGLNGLVSGHAGGGPGGGGGAWSEGILGAPSIAGGRRDTGIGGIGGDGGMRLYAYVGIGN